MKSPVKSVQNDVVSQFEDKEIPSSPEEREQFFVEQLKIAEDLMKKG
jgi:hypothetical protein